jgi:hypothetical protein
VMANGVPDSQMSKTCAVEVDDAKFKDGYQRRFETLRSSRTKHLNWGRRRKEEHCLCSANGERGFLRFREHRPRHCEESPRTVSGSTGPDRVALPVISGCVFNFSATALVSMRFLVALRTAETVRNILQY